MNAALTHRGPDDSGISDYGNVVLANRRLSIVDLNGGHQPMTTEDGRLAVTYNGEIYNAPQLRRQLERRGHRYRTHSDTESLLHLFAENGKALVDQLRGCYAFALWDSEAEELLLVRDRLGVKPLYFVHDRDGSLYFASEIKALVEAGVAPRELNIEALPGFLANRATSGEETLFAGVRRLLPGHLLAWRNGDVSIRQYWDVVNSPPDPRNDDDCIADWAGRFREAVELRLIADVPVGVFLSGGIDSSSIAAIMTELTDEPVRSFSVGFSEPGMRELPYARAVASQLHSHHRDVIVTPDAFFEALPSLTWHGDEPLGHPASVPLYFVSALASQEVKAVLSGEGADETLAGYLRYRSSLYNLKGGDLYKHLTSAAVRQRVSHRVNGRRLSRTFLKIPPNTRTLYFENFAVFSSEAQRRLLTADAAAQTNRIDPHLESFLHFDASASSELLERMLYADCKTYLHGLLMKQDKMTMAASLESRVPFLDHELVELSARLPTHLKLRHGWTTKYVLRRSMRGVLAADVLTRRKLGFPVPIDQWFRGAFRSVVDEYVLGERARRRGLFDPKFVSRLVAEYQAGARHGERLWALVSFEHWARCFIDAEEPEPIRFASV